MRKFILLLITAFTFYTTIQAQEGNNWIIKLNKQVLLRSPVETQEPVIYLSKSSLSGKNMITIQYNTTNGESDWKRQFQINDVSEQNYKQLELKNQSGSVSFPVKDLKKAAAENKPLFIYTLSIPKDPSKAALVRVRRFLLCKIEWKK